MITQKQLKKHIHYNPQNGIFIWINPTSNRIKAGSKVGNFCADGYIETKFLGNRTRLHRLAFLYMNGEIPSHVDHINHIRDDNRWCNLRPATLKDNARNISIGSLNRSGTLGVYFSKECKKWTAQIKYDGKTRYIGQFKNKKDAIKARKLEEKKQGFHPNHGMKK